MARCQWFAAMASSMPAAVMPRLEPPAPQNQSWYRSPFGALVDQA
jgi:hypothetical protein